MIRKYYREDVEFFKVTVNLYSKVDRKLRRQKFKSGIASLREAKRIEKELIRKAQNELSALESSSASWGELVEQWEMFHFNQSSQFGRKLQRITVIDHANALRDYTYDWLNTPANEITRSMAREVFDAMAEAGKSKSRRKSVKAAINNVFDWAIEDGKIKGVHVSPAKGFAFKQTEEKKSEILNINEIRLFLKVARDQKHSWYSIWSMALMTGMRSGELFALVWSDIDWDNKRITVSKSYNRRIKSVKCTKAGYWREVPINDELERLLKLLRVSAANREHVLPRLPHWEAGSASSVLRAFCAGNGLPSVRFHALRACFATQLIRDGVAPAIVMKICGWRDLKTMQRYIRLAGIEVEGATDQLKLLPEDQVMGRVQSLFVQ